MTMLKRLSTTLFARVDQFVGAIENHDAVIEAAIRDARQAAARAKVRLARVERDGERLRSRLAELRRAEASWTERARAVAGEDEDTALECLRRRRACRRQSQDLQTSLERHAELEDRLVRDIRAAEERLSDMTRQRNLMRSRHSAAEALKSVASIDASVATDLEDAFERWEMQITEAELAVGSGEPRDPLEREFMAAEEQGDLRAELSELLEDEDDRGGDEDER